MRITIIHPCVGRIPGQKYIRTWQMEPLPAATLAGLTPRDIEVKFYDDRMEVIPFDEATDLVAISVETYTAKRAYQIASEYRRRKIPVVMGGFHASLCPDEVSRYAESVVVGEAEQLWPTVVDDARHGRLQKYYRASGRSSLADMRPDRSIFRGKRYLPIGLVEAGRGCHFTCEFCAVQTVFDASQTRRPIDQILDEIRALKDEKKLFFFVDDNITSNLRQAKEFFRALIPLGVRWVSQASINAAHDEEFLELLVRSGCQGVLIGFESLNPANLESMNKRFNQAKGGFEQALANLRRHKIRVYGTFIFGYDGDTPESFAPTVSFAQEHAFYIAAFNHLTPFPGTPLYKRLEAEGRLLYEAWWMDARYSYNRIPFTPKGMAPDDLQRSCLAARREFYGWPSILRRSLDSVNRGNGFMWRNFYLINSMHRADVSLRDHYPLGDMAWQGALLPRELTSELTAERDPRSEGVTAFAPEDDAELRALLRAAVIPGAVRVAFTREPSYAAGEGLAGAHDHTVVARRDGALVGVGRCSILPLYRNGQVQRIGYLGELRLVPGTARAVRLLRAGYSALAEAVAADEVDAFFTSITSDNGRARRVLEHGGRMGLPAYRSIASLVTLIAPLRRTARAATSEAGSPCTPNEQDELLAFLDRQAQGAHLTLSWCATRVRALAAHGVRLDDFLLVRRRGAIVGAAAIWDQRPFRQIVVDGYDRALRLARPLANVALQLTARTPLPPPGSVLAQGALLGAAVAHPSDWAVLWPALARRAAQQGLDWLSLSRDARAPELPTLRSILHAREYHTTLYDVALGGSTTHAPWDARLVRPEVGLL